MAVKYLFKGKIPNEDVQKYYHDHKVDCFITTSSTEGLPVSIMEAMAYGIPIVATDVGGIAELVNTNGKLLSSNPSPYDIAESIIDIMSLSELTKEKMRTSSRTAWEKLFDAKKNASLFSEKLSKQYGSKERIVVITEGYPFGGEKSFIEAEIKELIKSYDITIIAIVSSKISKEEKIRCLKQLRKICGCGVITNKNVEVYEYVNKWNYFVVFPYLVKYFLSGKVAIERREISKERTKRLLKTWNSAKYYMSAQQFYRWLCNNGIIKHEDNKTVFYSFWCTFATLAACLHKDENSSLNIITRAHGFDLYNERVAKTKRQPFRQLITEKADGIYLVSKKSKKYYDDRWNKNGLNKTFTAYIGAEKLFPDCELKECDKDIFRIVSCSNLIPLKRVDLIIEALSILEKRMPCKKVEWIHFGDGELRLFIEEYASSKLGHV